MSLRRKLLYGGGAFGWSPYALPASIRAGWWVASDHGTVQMTDDGLGLISSWKSRSTLLDVTATLTARPTWSATGFAGAYDALIGDGLANAMTMAGTAGLPTGSTPSAICVLGTGSGADGTARQPAGYGGVSANARRLRKTSAGGFQAGDGTTSTATAGLWDSPAISIGIWAGTTETQRANGAVVGEATIATLATTTTRLRLFGDTANTPGTFWSGPIAEVIILASPTLDMLQRVEGYWAWTYPLAGLVAWLPDGHPYKKAAP